MGNVLQGGLGQCPARQAAIGAGLGWDVTASTVNKVCLSGLAAIIDAARIIRCGDAAVVVAGGMESMTNAPHLLAQVAIRLHLRQRRGHRQSWPTTGSPTPGAMRRWAWTPTSAPPSTRLPARTRTRSSARSHRLAAKAWAEGVFDDEVVRCHPCKQKRHRVVDLPDEGIRPDSTAESLARLRPAFRPDGTITAGNASQINDGGAAVVLTTRANAEAKGWTVMATLRAAGQVAGPSPALAPQPGNAIAKALGLQGWTVADLDLVEINEAFAAVAVYAVRQLGVPLEKVNIHGGGIAVGHPIGQSGARLVVHLAHELHRRGRRPRGGRALWRYRPGRRPVAGGLKEMI